VADQYDALVSGTPTDPAQQRALAAALRKQAAVAEAYQATGDRVISPLGQTMGKNIEGQLGDINSDRNRQSALAQALQFHKDQQASEQASLAERTREANMTDARTREQNALMNKFRNDQLAQEKELKEESLAQQKALADEKAKAGKPIPISMQKDIEGNMDSMRGVDAALEQAQAMDKQGIQLGGVTRGLKNSMAAAGLGTDEMQAVQNFWAQYGSQFTLPELKNTIGIRHNEYMQHLFESYHIDPRMTNEQIIQRLNQISQSGHARIQSRIGDTASLGYDVGKYADQLPESGVAPANQVSPGDKYIQAHKQAQMQPAPQGNGMPTWQMFPQTGLQQQQQQQYPTIPGMTTLMNSIPQSSPQ